jgi:hypothetical protein
VRVPKGAGPDSAVTEIEARAIDHPGEDIGRKASTATAANSTAIAAVVVGERVDTKRTDVCTFGNDTVGFIRVRRRQLKGGHAEWREYRAQSGALATSSKSYDLVRAVRINGKPRHEFILGLGSQKNVQRNGYGWFWVRVVQRMTKHGLSEYQRQRLFAEMIRKGAQLPTITQCEDCVRSWPPTQAAVEEIVRLIGDAT